MGSFETRKVGCVSPMVGVSILPHAKFGPNDHQEGAHDFRRPRDQSYI